MVQVLESTPAGGEFLHAASVAPCPGPSDYVAFLKLMVDHELSGGLARTECTLRAMTMKIAEEYERAEAPRRAILNFTGEFFGPLGSIDGAMTERMDTLRALMLGRGGR